jgi:hypothetical protein
MTEQSTPEPTEQEAADEFYNTIYGAQPPQLSTEDEALYTQYFPNN